MGQVYRAKDRELKRDVAIKMLPDAFAGDPDRLRRFQREAELLASLNHPNIGSIYALEEANGARFLVLELIEGETLAQRIKRGPVPIDEALVMAKSICEALEAAHERGVVHRDLKPANMKITPDGNLKVLDFGLARAFAGDVDQNLSNSPASMEGTTPGLIIGTAAYMSPEQVKGKRADRSTDAWAFGAILYELLTGRAVFEGATPGEIFARIIEAEPVWHLLPATTPEGIRRLLRRCLEKDEKRRLRDMREARLEIENAGSTQEIDRNVTQSRSRSQRLVVSVIAVLLVMTIVLAVLASRPTPAASEMRVEINTPQTTKPEALAISPDGQKILFDAIFQDVPRLWLRSLDSISARPLANTDNAFSPFWSPDGQSIGFFADGKLKRLEIDGGSVQELVNVPAVLGGTWNRDGVILFATQNSPILRINATGGEPTPVTRVAASQSHRHPQFLPDGRHFLYYVTGTPEVRGVYIGELDGSETRRLLDADAGAVYGSSGHLLFVRQGTLFAQTLDPERFELSGKLTPVAEHVAVNNAPDSAAVAASAAGPIIYRTGSSGVPRQFIWFDRSGAQVGTVGEVDGGAVQDPSLSRDGRRVAFNAETNAKIDIWLLDAARSVKSQFTSDTGHGHRAPVWSPDGDRIAFSSSRTTTADLYQMRTSGIGGEELLVGSPQQKMVSDWSTDGRYLLYRSRDPKTGYDIWAMPFDEDRRPFLVVQTSFDERDGQFSPDGRWIAYQSNKSGRYEIYIQPFKHQEARVDGTLQITTHGGAHVRWGRDGKELFYISLDGQLMVVPIRLNSSHTLEPGEPVPLFVTRIGHAIRRNEVNRQQYMVSSDSQRFLINTAMEEVTSPITIILNWKARP